MNLRRLEKLEEQTRLLLFAEYDRLRTPLIVRIRAILSPQELIAITDAMRVGQAAVESHPAWNRVTADPDSGGCARGTARFLHPC